MNTYAIQMGSIYTEIPEELGVPFRFIHQNQHPLTPFGVTIVPLGEDLVVVDGFTDKRGKFVYADRPKFADGWLFAAVQTRPRLEPIKLGEFFIPDLRYQVYRRELQNHERPSDG